MHIVQWVHNTRTAGFSTPFNQFAADSLGLKLISLLLLSAAFENCMPVMVNGDCFLISAKYDEADRHKSTEKHCAKNC